MLKRSMSQVQKRNIIHSEKTKINSNKMKYSMIMMCIAKIMKPNKINSKIKIEVRIMIRIIPNLMEKMMNNTMTITK